MEAAAKTIFPKFKAPVPLARPPRTRQGGMVCPTCGAQSVAVVDSRVAPGNTVRRRRCCEKCGYRFTTFEVGGEMIDAINQLGELVLALRQIPARVESVMADIEPILAALPKMADFQGSNDE